MRAAALAMLGLLAAACPVVAAAQDRATDDALAVLARDVKRAGIEEPLGFDAQIAKGRAHLRAGRWVKAADAFFNAEKLSPSHPLPEIHLAHLMIGRHSWHEARLHLQRVLGNYPMWRRLRYDLASEFGGKQALAGHVRALEASRHAEPLGSPTRAERAFVLGYCYLAQGATSKAKIAFAEAGKGPGAVAEARDYLEDLQKPAAAPARIDKPELIDPQRRAQPGAAPATPAAPGAAPAAGNPQAKTDPFDRGNALVLQGRYDDAADAFVAAVIENPGGTNGILAHFELSHALFAMGRWPEAHTALRRGLRRFPDWGKVTMNRRDWYPPSRPGDFETHFRALEAAVQAEYTDARLQFLLGYTSYFIGRLQQARTAFRMAERLNAPKGGDADATRFRQWCDEAMQLLPDGPAGPQPGAPAKEPEAQDGTPARPPTPGSQPSAAERAATLFAAKQYTAAWTAVQRAVAAAPAEPGLQMLAARAAFAAGEWERAMAHLRAGLKQSGRDRWGSLTGEWLGAFPDRAHYDRRLAELENHLKEYAHHNKQEQRFLAGFCRLATGGFEAARGHFRVHYYLGGKDDPEAAFFHDRLKVKD
jgi:tetratricopeptide (TPR) repeat protein